MRGSEPGARDVAVRRVADVHLRGRRGSLRGRIFWPSSAGRPERLMVAFGLAEASARALCVSVGLIVLSVDPTDCRDAKLALDWAGEHAADLTAAPGGLLVAAAGSAAAHLVGAAGLEGWPPVIHQFLVTEDGKPGRSVSKTAPQIRLNHEDVARRGQQSVPTTVIAAGRQAESDLIAAAHRALTAAPPRPRRPR